MIIQGMSYLTDPNKQFVTKGGAPNVGGFVRVYLANTDDPATTYSDFNGTRNQQEIRLDNNGRAVIIAKASKAYRVEVYDRLGGLQWTVQPLFCLEGSGGGGGGGGGMQPSILVAQKWGAHYVSGTDDGTDGTTDGIFLFQEKEKLGEDIWVDENDHKIYCKKGWYHFDFQVFFFVNPIAYPYNGGTQPRIDTVQVNAGGRGDSLRVDLDRGTTDSYSTTAQFGADIYASFDGFNISATIDGLGYYSYAHVGLMAIHKIAED